MSNYWTRVEVDALKRVNSLEETADVAVSILHRMNKTQKEIVQILGPMSTGGKGNFAENMIVFERAITCAINHGLLVFNQIPFQEALIRLCDFKDGQKHYNWEILTVFYRRIFESGFIHRTLFLPGWESSVGATWERTFVAGLGIKVEDYPVEWLS